MNLREAFLSRAEAISPVLEGMKKEVKSLNQQMFWCHLRAYLLSAFLLLFFNVVMWYFLRMSEFLASWDFLDLIEERWFTTRLFSLIVSNWILITVFYLVIITGWYQRDKKGDIKWSREVARNRLRAILVNLDRKLGEAPLCSIQYFDAALLGIFDVEYILKDFVPIRYLCHVRARDTKEELVLVIDSRAFEAALSGKLKELEFEVIWVSRASSSIDFLRYELAEAILQEKLVPVASCSIYNPLDPLKVLSEHKPWNRGHRYKG